MKRIIALFFVIASVAILPAAVTAPFSTRTYPLADFTNLQVSNVVKVIYTQGDSYSVQLTGRTDWLDLMEVTASGGTLQVRAQKTKKFNNVKKKDQPDGEHNFILHLTAPCLQNINLSGVSAFEGKRLTPDYFHVRLEGVSKFKAESVECAQFSTVVTGVSSVSIGKVESSIFSADVVGSSNADIQYLKAKKVQCIISGASKASLRQLSQGEEASFALNGASKITLSAEASGQMQVGLSGASKCELTFKGGTLRTACTGASKLHADVNCKAVNANCDGASKTSFSGTADKVEIDRGGVAVNIDTSRLNQF
ncbi:MAG: DUF2807 domain-containing protein [Bacteroidaceae bacterium]|nr:DUF2807 domain-containing protein [Bacteroidaceae bacterium]